MKRTRILKGKKTKSVGYLIVLVSILNMIVDILNGKHFALNQHYVEIINSLIGIGFIFLRSALPKEFLKHDDVIIDKTLK